jgi:hypothetical protein
MQRLTAGEKAVLAGNEATQRVTRLLPPYTVAVISGCYHGHISSRQRPEPVGSICGPTDRS